jgi:hypothetical protein
MAVQRELAVAVRLLLEDLATHIVPLPLSIVNYVPRQDAVMMSC